MPAARDPPGTPAARGAPCWPPPGTDRVRCHSAPRRSGQSAAPWSRLDGAPQRSAQSAPAWQSRYLEPGVDVGFVADLLQPQLRGFLDPAVAHRLVGALARRLVGV